MILILSIARHKLAWFNVHHQFHMSLTGNLCSIPQHICNMGNKLSLQYKNKICREQSLVVPYKVSKDLCLVPWVS